MKRQYRVRNWSEYNSGLKQRGSLTFWVSEEALDHWLVQDKTGECAVLNPMIQVAKPESYPIDP